MDLAEITMWASIATLIVAIITACVALWAGWLSWQTGKILERTKDTLDHTDDLIENQQFVLMAMGRILGGDVYSKLVLSMTSKYKHLKEAERAGIIKGFSSNWHGKQVMIVNQEKFAIWCEERGIDPSTINADIATEE